MDDLPITTTEHLRATMERVSFKPSCLDMGWGWEVEGGIFDARARGVFVAWRIRCSFQRPERDSGEVGTGFGRWWLIERGTTESAVVKTMFAAAKMIVEHELLEAFKVDGRRPFDPHRTVQDLISGAEER